MHSTNSINYIDESDSATINSVTTENRPIIDSNQACSSQINKNLGFTYFYIKKEHTNLQLVEALKSIDSEQLAGRLIDDKIFANWPSEEILRPVVDNYLSYLINVVGFVIQQRESFSREIKYLRDENIKLYNSICMRCCITPRTNDIINNAKNITLTENLAHSRDYDEIAKNIADGFISHIRVVIVNTCVPSAPSNKKSVSFSYHDPKLIWEYIENDINKKIKLGENFIDRDMRDLVHEKSFLKKIRLRLLDTKNNQNITSGTIGLLSGTTSIALTLLYFSSSYLVGQIIFALGTCFGIGLGSKIAMSKCCRRKVSYAEALEALEGKKQNNSIGVYKQNSSDTHEIEAQQPLVTNSSIEKPRKIDNNALSNELNEVTVEGTGKKLKVIKC